MWHFPFGVNIKAYTHPHAYQLFLLLLPMSSYWRRMWKISIFHKTTPTNFSFIKFGLTFITPSKDIWLKLYIDESMHSMENIANHFHWWAKKIVQFGKESCFIEMVKMILSPFRISLKKIQMKHSFTSQRLKYLTFGCVCVYVVYTKLSVEMCYGKASWIKWSLRKCQWYYCRHVEWLAFIQL